MGGPVKAHEHRFKRKEDNIGWRLQNLKVSFNFISIMRT